MASVLGDVASGGARRGATPVRDALVRTLGADGPADVVDLGGGTGGLAVDLAGLGHRVTVVDPSPDALAMLARRARDAGLPGPPAGSVRGLLGDAWSLPDLVGERSADLLVCHGVLEVVDDPAQALAAAARVVRPGGRLSVLVPQLAGAVFAAVLAGRYADATAMLRADEPVGERADEPAVEGAGGERAGRAARRFTRAQVEDLVVTAGFDVAEVRGVRVFTDHVDHADVAGRWGRLGRTNEAGRVWGARQVDAHPDDATLLAGLEAGVCEHADYLPLATQLHLLAVRR